MFIEVNLIKSGNWKGQPPNTFSEYMVCDTDFNETVWASDLMDAFRKVYENKNADIPKNLIRFIRWWEKHWNHNFFDYVGGNNRFGSSPTEWQKYVSLYKEDIDKYLMLV